MLEYAQKWNVELLLATGPRATIDTSASVNTPEGVRMGYRLRGQEQIVRAVEDIRRAAKIGASVVDEPDATRWIPSCGRAF